MTAGRVRTALPIILPAVALLVIALVNSSHKSLWTDESYSLNTAMRPLAGTIHQALHFELQPPLYFVLLNGWLTLHAGVGFARLLSLGCVLGAIGVLAAIGRLIGLRGWLAPAALAAMTPGVIWAASEARVYGLSLLLASATLYCFLRLIATPPERSGRATLLYAAVAYLSVLTFYYNGFLLLGQWVAAVATRRQARPVTVAVVLVGLALAPWAPTILSQKATHPIEVPTDARGQSLQRRIFVTAGTPLKAFLTDTYVIDRPHAIALAWIILALVPLIRLVAGRVPWGTDEWMLTIATVVPLAILCALAFLRVVPIRHRHLILLIPVSLTLFSVWLSRTRAGVARIGSTALLVGLLAVLVVSFELDPQHPEDWRETADYLAQQMAPGDHVIVFDPDRALPLQYYLGRRTVAAGVPMDADLEHYRPSEYAIRDTTVLADRLKAVGGAGGIWFVRATRLEPGLEPSIGVIDAFVARHYLVGPPVEFRGVRVTHLQSRDRDEHAAS